MLWQTGAQQGQFALAANQWLAWHGHEAPAAVEDELDWGAEDALLDGVPDEELGW